MACAHFIVSGQVQGVGFRAATQARARALQLRGWVRNRDDGSVELLASGTAAALQALAQWLWQGPPAAHVQAVMRQAHAAYDGADFIIR